MCLYIRNIKPKVAKRDIAVLKYLYRMDNISFISPCQHTPVYLGEIMVPKTNKPKIEYRITDDFGNQIYGMYGGVIHARLSESDKYGNYCAKAIIPKGANYWINPFNFDIAADKMLVTNVEVNADVLDDTFAKEILKDAPKKNGIKVGSYIMEDGTFKTPSKRISKNRVKGIVCGFYEDNSPIICALDLFNEVWDNTSRIMIGTYLNRNDAKEVFNAKEATARYKYRFKNNNDILSPAFEHCINYRKDKDEEWYFGSLKENMIMLNNAIYLNAAHKITGLGFVFDIGQWFWSCSEYDRVHTHSWGCTLYDCGVYYNWCHKQSSGGVVPFFAQKR